MIKCELCGKHFKSLSSLSCHLSYPKHSCKINLKEYYDKYLKTEDEGFCIICRNQTSFINLSKGYKKYCSNFCSNNSKEVKNKKKHTSIKNYGTEHPIQSEKIKNKYKQTNLNKYGVENPLQSEKIKEKYKQTILEKYGVEYIPQSKDIKNKIKQTNLEKYGVDNPLKLEEIKKKSKKNNLERYGVEHISQSEDIKNKIKQTNFERYGVDNVFKNEEIKNRQKETLINNFGVSHPMKIDSVKKKISEKIRKNFENEFIRVLDYLNLELLDEEYQHSHYLHNWKCTKCDYRFMKIWNEIQQGYTCPICYPRIQNKESTFEMELCKFLDEYEIIYVKNERKVIYPKELDIYIPDKNIAIEFNGLYWHSSSFISDPYYHLNKTKECEKQGIQLIHIFEDELIHKPNIVKERLKQILNINNSTKVNARDCYIQEINSKTKNEFLDEFHLQGKDSSSIKLGAFYNNQLISVMTFSKGNISKGSKPQKNIWELNRFCSNYNYRIPGIVGKLLEYFKRNYVWDEIFTYADRRWSKGNLYYQLNFEFKYYTSPNYWYINDLTINRIHRFNLRKTKNDPKNIPEWFLRQSQGYKKIWDCGNIKFRQKK